MCEVHSTGGRGDDDDHDAFSISSPSWPYCKFHSVYYFSNLIFISLDSRLSRRLSFSFSPPQVSLSSCSVAHLHRTLIVVPWKYRGRRTIRSIGRAAAVPLQIYRNGQQVRTFRTDRNLIRIRIVADRWTGERIVIRLDVVVMMRKMGTGER